MRNRMGVLYRMVTAAIGFSLALLPLALPAAALGTTLHDIRFGMHSDHTRLVFDAEGDRPLRVGPATEEGITVAYARLQTGPHWNKRLSALKASVALVLRESDGLSEVQITFPHRKTTVQHQFLASSPKSSGRYRLVLDFFPPSSSQAQTDGAALAAASTQKTAMDNKSEGLKEPTPRKETTPGGSKGKAAAFKPNEVSGSPPPEQPAAQPAVIDEEAAALYEQADRAFLAGQQNLSQGAFPILAQYTDALKAAPGAPQAPVALYRCGLIHATLGNPTRAEKYFQQAISNFPDHPVATSCWMELGQIYHKKQSYIEASEAFRFALRGPLDKDARTEAIYQLGKNLSIVGAHKEAVQTLTQCLNEDPQWHLKKPDIFRYLGESCFTLQQYDAGGQWLFRYLNLQPDSTDRDLILAKIAEIFLQQSQQELASKLYAYIQKHHQGSEGDTISQIRKAEFLEKRESDPQRQAEALVIYEELSRKDLPPALGKLVHFKVASWEWKHKNFDKSLELIDTVLQTKVDTNSHDEFILLREKVLADFTRKLFAEKEHVRLIQLVETYAAAFQAMQSPELDALIAQSYGTLSLYAKAIELYERLLAADKKKNEEWLLRTAQYAFLLGDLDKAAQACRQVQSEPFDTQKTELLGRIATMQGKDAEAVKLFVKLSQKDKDLAQTNQAGVLSYIQSLMNLGKHDDALAVLQKAIERLTGEDSEKRVQLTLLSGKCYQELKQPQKAIETLEAALPLTASEDQRNRVNYEIAKLFLAAGHPDRASQKLTQLMGTSQSFWKTAAQQQLDSIQMQRTP